jgi:hypothetical protein
MRDIAEIIRDISNSADINPDEKNYVMGKISAKLRQPNSARVTAILLKLSFYNNKGTYDYNRQSHRDNQ